MSENFFIVVNIKNQKILLVWVPSRQWATDPRSIPALVADPGIRYIGGDEYLYGDNKQIIGPRHLLVYDGGAISIVNPYNNDGIEHWHHIKNGNIESEPFLTTLRQNWGELPASHQPKAIPSSIATAAPQS